MPVDGSCVVRERKKPWSHAGLCGTLVLATALFAAVPDTAPDAVDIATLKVCDRMMRLFRADADRIWPGYDLSVRPLIIYRPNKWALLLNEKQATDGFSTLPPGWPEMPQAQYHPGPYRDLVGQLGFDIPVASGRAAAMPVSDTYMRNSTDSAHLFAFVVHENFHQFQDEVFTETDSLNEERYPIADRENTALAFVEMEILRDVLTAAQAGDDVSVRTLLRKFVAVRNARWNRNPFVRSFEAAEERHEGTAQYVEVKAMDLVQRSFSHAEVPARETEGYAEYAHPQYLFSEFSSRTTGGTVAPADMPRNRIYPVGAAMGMLLDFLGVDWKGQVGADAANTFVSSLSSALHTGESDLASELVAAKKEYRYEDAVKAAGNLIQQHEDGFRAELHEFENQHGYRVQIRVRSGNLHRSGSTSARKWIVDDGARSLCKLYAVYTLRSPVLTLSLHDVAVLEEQDWAAGTKAVTFFVPTEPAILIEGKKLQAAPGEPKSFPSLKFGADTSEFQTDVRGRIRIDGHSITIDLIPSA
jgi:hypothetical protein